MHALILAETSIPAVVSLLFFFSLFIGILIWLYVAGRNGRWARDARMPLDDVNPVEPRIRQSQEKSNG
ncbi:MAG: cbb3-type cytochrome c oxidase subunit 3 [Phycisphaerae bacterium]|nr:cbb3-type cytochrome c oxidase subunit 3 [Phycisphaerae bacterium]